MVTVVAGGAPPGTQAGTYTRPGSPILRSRLEVQAWTQMELLRRVRASQPTDDDMLVAAALILQSHAGDPGSSELVNTVKDAPVPAAASDNGMPTFPDRGVTVEVMEAILRDDRITALSTTDLVCHTILKPATVPPGWEELIDTQPMPWGTLYKASYRQHGTGLIQHTPPAGTLCLADKLAAVGHSGIGKANVFFSHAWKFRFADVVAAMRTFVEQQRRAGHHEPTYFWCARQTGGTAV